MIYIADTCGLCEGAARALHITREELANNARPIVLYNDLLHNATVMQQLREQDVQTVSDVQDVPKEAVMIVSAHGMAAKNYRYLKDHGIACVDATCPKVISIHKIAEKGCREGRAVVIVGKKNHPEVVGISGWCQDQAVIIQSEDDLPLLQQVKTDQVLLICQSTFNEKKAAVLVEKVIDALPGKDIQVKNTICPAQRNIQHASVEMAKKCDVVFVLGGYNSSNTVELFNLCQETGTSCHHIDSLASFYHLIQQLPLSSEQNIGLTAGASTTKEEIESCRALLSFYLYYKENSQLLNQDLQLFNQRPGHNNPIVDNFIQAFAAVNQGGKNLRGVLVGLGYQLAGGDDVAYSRPLGMAAEIFQSAILVHDDIIDHAFVRRGLPTVPQQLRQQYARRLGEKAGEEAAGIADSVGICAGDLGFFYANQLLCQHYADHPGFAGIMHYFSQMAINTIYGEVLDVVLPFEEKHGIAEGSREDSVMEIYHLKTAWYSVVGPLCLGMLLAGVEETHLRAMEEMADHLGLAFQIKDDLMGVFSQEEDMGKPMSDIAEYKQTLLYAYVRDRAPHYKNILQRHYGNTPLTQEDIKAVRDIFTQSGARRYAEAKMADLFASAESKLKNMSFISAQYKDIIFGFMRYLQLRTK